MSEDPHGETKAVQPESVGGYEPYFSTERGEMVLADSRETLAGLASASVDLIVTSPPFPLLRKKEYGNVAEAEYLEWFRGFAAEFRRVLKPEGSLVLDLGGAWLPGLPAKSPYQFRLLLMLIDELGFHLAHDMYWWQPSRLPSPAEWVTVRRVRTKDAVNTIWWLSPSGWPKADNRRVSVPYSKSQIRRIADGEKPLVKPSGHATTESLGNDNGAAIPPNLIALPHSESSSAYLAYCAAEGITPHPARFPTGLPEYFVRMLTDRGDFVVDPFGGSCATGEVCERLDRRWLCIDQEEQYLAGAVGRFHPAPSGGGYDETEAHCREAEQARLFEGSGYQSGRPSQPAAGSSAQSYAVPNPAALWAGVPEETLSVAGGRTHHSTGPSR